VVDNAVYLIQLNNTDGKRPIVIAERGAPPTRDLVSNSGCETCHGDYVFADSHYTIAAEYCQVCHVRDGRDFYIADTLEENDTGNSRANPPIPPSQEFQDNPNQGDGGNLPIYAHGVHNSHNMPAGVAYFHGDEWSVGYPSSPNNCISCHVSDEQLTAATEAPVSFYLCMTCHADESVVNEFVDVSFKNPNDLLFGVTGVTVADGMVDFT